jgi:hypothetical protein
MRCDDFNATMWRRGINCLLAETRGDSLGPLRARMMPCPTPRSPEPLGKAETSLEGSGKARSAFIGPAGPETSLELALSLAPRLQGSGEEELVLRSSDSPGLMPRPPKRSWAFSAKAHDQVPAGL